MSQVRLGRHYTSRGSADMYLRRPGLGIRDNALRRFQLELPVIARSASTPESKIGRRLRGDWEAE